MLVAVNTKSWTGRYHTNVVWFNDEQHLDNYLAVEHAIRDLDAKRARDPGAGLRTDLSLPQNKGLGGILGECMDITPGGSRPVYSNAYSTLQT